MRRALMILLLAPLGVTARAAAPPLTWRALTAEEAKHVAALEARATRHAAAGEFEEAAALAEQMASFQAQRQGRRHWQAIDARLVAQGWRGLAAVPVKDRTEVLRARALSGSGMALLNQGRYREAEPSLRQALAVYQQVLGEYHD